MSLSGASENHLPSSHLVKYKVLLHHPPCPNNVSKDKVDFPVTAALVFPRTSCSVCLFRASITHLALLLTFSLGLLDLNLFHHLHNNCPGSSEDEVAHCPVVVREDVQAVH